MTGPAAASMENALAMNIVHPARKLSRDKNADMMQPSVETTDLTL